MRYFACLATFSLLVASSFPKEPQKIALIVAVSNYEENSGWNQLNAFNDIELIREALLKQGFKSKDIVILQEEQATQAGVRSAIKKDLIKKAKPGAIALFHFSGHGQQIFDQDGDEVDGFDEALVPFDSPQDFQAGVYEGERLITDDELGRLLTKLREKLGPEGQLITVIDACHSGTSTRGYNTTRGTQKKMAPSNMDLNSIKGMTDVAQLATDFTTVGVQGAPMVAFFASAANELNYEYLDSDGKRYGALSYAFSKAFQNLSAETSYQALFDQIKLEMNALAPRQTPQVEGPLDLMVMGGAIEPIPQYFEVVRWYSPKTVLINAGTIAGLHPGSTIKLYPIDTRDTTGVAPIATGQVQNTLALLAELSLDQPIEQKQALGSWCFVEVQNYGPVGIKLRLDLKTSQFEPILRKALAPYYCIQLDSLNPDLILSDNLDGQLQLNSKDDFRLMQITQREYTEQEAARVLIKRMLTYTQAEYLRHLKMETDFLNVEMELIPVSLRQKGLEVEVDQKFPLAQKLGNDGIIRFQEEESFVIQVTNKGKVPAYFTVLDIQADNQVTTVIPHPYCQLKAQDYYIEPGATKELDCIIDIFPPYGNEVLKLIATEQPINLRRIIDTRGEKASATNPFEQLFQATFIQENSRGVTPSIPPTAAHIHSVTFKIVPD